MIIVHRNLCSAIVDYTNFTIKLAWIYSLQKSICKQSSRTSIADHLETHTWERTSSNEKLGSRFFDTCLIVMVRKNNYTDTDLKHRHRPSSIAHHQLTVAGFRFNSPNFNSPKNPHPDPNPNPNPNLNWNSANWKDTLSLILLGVIMVETSVITRVWWSLASGRSLYWRIRR